jgi:hypothetical protein
MGESDFCKRHLGAAIALDTDKMISSGQSYGGMSAISIALGDQPHFKAVVTHDPCFFPCFPMIDNASFDMRHPTFMCMSESFLGSMNDMIFYFPRDLWKDFDSITANFKKTIPDEKLEVIKLMDSNHIDQGDGCVTDEFLTSLLNKFLFKTSATKKYGSQVEYYEYITMLWLRFLYKVDMHDNTFDFNEVNKRSKQFEKSEVVL